MATLLGTKIKDTYAGLLKTDNNLEIGSGVSGIQDGAGNQSALYLGQDAANITSGDQSLTINQTNTQLRGTTILASDATDTNLLQLDSNLAAIGNATNYLTIGATGSQFVGDLDFTIGATIDFTGTTVTGLPSGGGLADGTGTDSMASTLTVTPATASGTGSIALGRNSRALGNGSISIGEATQASNSNSVMLGAFAGSTGSGSTALGWAASAATTFSVGIGRLTNQSGGNEQVAIGNFARANSEKGIAIGAGATVSAGAAGAVALGRSVTAAIADTVSVNALEIQSNTDSITMYSPDGTEWKVTVTNAGTLLVTNA